MNADQIKKDGEDALNAVVDQFGDAAEHMQGAVHRAKDQFMAWEKQGAECAREAAQQADQFVHDQPWQAAGIAGAVGLVVGLLISRR